MYVGIFAETFKICKISFYQFIIKFLEINLALEIAQKSKINYTNCKFYTKIKKKIQIQF